VGCEGPVSRSSECDPCAEDTVRSVGFKRPKEYVYLCESYSDEPANKQIDNHIRRYGDSKIICSLSRILQAMQHMKAAHERSGDDFFERLLRSIWHRNQDPCKCDS